MPTHQKRSKRKPLHSLSLSLSSLLSLSLSLSHSLSLSFLKFFSFFCFQFFEFSENDRRRREKRLSKGARERGVMRRKRPTRTSVMVRVLMAALAVALAAVLVVQLTSVTSSSSTSSPPSSRSTSPSFTEEEKPRTHQVMNHEKEKEKEEAVRVSTSDATGEDGKVKDAADEIPALYTYKVVKEYAHDYDAFTQGFLYQEECQDFFNSIDKSKCKDMFLESTGTFLSSVSIAVSFVLTLISSKTGIVTDSTVVVVVFKFPRFFFSSLSPSLLPRFVWEDSSEEGGLA